MAKTGRRCGDVLDADCPSRQVLDRIADKWTALIIRVLADGTHAGAMARDADIRDARA